MTITQRQIDRIQNNLASIESQAHRFMGEAKAVGLMFNEETTVFGESGINTVVEPVDIDGFYGVYNEDTRTIVHVAKPSYKLVQNKDITSLGLDLLEQSGIDAKVDTLHSYVNATEMRLVLVTGNMLFNDGVSDIMQTIELRNSYDASTTIGFSFGAIRQICSNGMIGNKTIASTKFRHTTGFEISKMAEQIGKLDLVSEKMTDAISTLADTRWTKDSEQTKEWFVKHYGKRKGVKIMESAVGSDMPATQWDMLQRLTWYISHEVEVGRRDYEQSKLTRIPEFAVL